MLDCVLFKDEEIFVERNLLYELSEIKDERYLIFSHSGEITGSLNFYKIINSKSSKHGNIISFKYNHDTYIILNPCEHKPTFSTCIKYKNNDVMINLSNELVVSISGEILLEQKIDLEYSHYEIENDSLFIYFTGKREYVVVISKNELKFAGYIDECNIDGEEKYFLTKKRDSLNHGAVCHVTKGEIDNYLVYLDDYGMNLKREFVVGVYLDCIKAGNLNYAHALMSGEFSSVNTETLSEFFPKFDSFVCLDETSVAFINKNTLAGIFKFEIDKDSIQNIIQID